MNMAINIESTWLSAEQIKTVEKVKSAKYVCELAIKGANGGWINQPCLIFYNEEKHPVSNSHYFALLSMGEQMAVTNGQSAVDETFTGICADDGEIIYSRFRHDYRTSKDGSVTIDGGRDYVRSSSGPAKLVTLKILNDRVVEVSNDDSKI